MPIIQIPITVIFETIKSVLQGLSDQAKTKINIFEKMICRFFQNDILILKIRGDILEL